MMEIHVHIPESLGEKAKRIAKENSLSIEDVLIRGLERFPEKGERAHRSEDWQIPSSSEAELADLTAPEIKAISRSDDRLLW